MFGVLSCLAAGLGAAAAALRAYNDPVYNQTFFPSLENYQVNATFVSEERYPWVARVVHSRTADMPYLCTAVCLQPRIFMTAARCLINLKVYHTTVIYKQVRHFAVALVVPRNETKQSFDDIGFVVVKNDYQGEWSTAKLIGTNRTDEHFKWFDELNLSFGPHDHRVVAYAFRKYIHKMRHPKPFCELIELQVIVGIRICNEIYTFKNRITGFFVPCYHSCNVHDFDQKSVNCKKYVGVEGGAIIDGKTQTILGIATWGVYYHKYELPVGFAVPNSENFFKDYECAVRIRNDNTELPITGYYQSLCPD